MRKDNDRNYTEFRAKKQKEAGGQIKLSGAFLNEHKDEVLNLIKNQSRLFEQNSPDHKVTDITKVDGGIVVTTSSHNLAAHLGKALSHAFKGKHKLNFSKDEQYVEVDWRRD